MLRATVILAVLLLAQACCCPIGPSSPEERAARAEREAARAAERQAAIARSTTRAQAYANARTLIDPTAAVPVVACPESEIEAARGGGPVIVSLMIPTVDYGSLPGAPQPTPPEWTWLGNSALDPIARLHREPAAVDDETKARAGDVTHRWLAVFVAHERVMPRVVGDGWEGGRIRGGVYVVDLDTSRVICSTPFSAESSDDVEVDDEGILRTSLAEAIEEDFQENVEAEATDALQEHTVHFNLNLVGIL